MNIVYRLTVFTALALSGLIGLVSAEEHPFRAGAAKVDITPEKLPVIQNGGFLQRIVGKVQDPLHSRALVLEDRDSKTRVAIAIVDSCMIPRTMCDEVKKMVTRATGIPRDHILIAATHTHSAPSVMNFCLGTRKDPAYSEFLPAKIAESIEKAAAALQPARAGWTKFDAGAFTKTRRWITRPDKIGVDPFGEQSVRAMMHPGNQNPNYTGESGPVDPWFSILSLQSLDGVPLAVLGNFSMHYFSGMPGLSADYFGVFARKISERMAAGNPKFVGILSQGTSGDSWRGDYSKPRAAGPSLENYTSDIVDLAVKSIEKINYHESPPLAMAESRITLNRRLPDARRLAWAKPIVNAMGVRRPKDRTEVYAEQAIFLHDNPREEIVLQALQVGGLAITAIPNEVYALTGLKLKRQSPLSTTMNISLANGAAGYIPPPEQHHLGGYTTWPARTAGLEVEAEPKIVEAVLQLLHKVSGKQVRSYQEARGAYAAAIQNQKPILLESMGEMQGSAKFENGVAFHLPGVTGNGFPAANDSRCAHFAGGRMKLHPGELGDDYSVSMWIWNAIPADVRPVTGYVFSRGKNGDTLASGDHLGIGGTHASGGRLMLFNGNEKDDLLGGVTELPLREWVHVTLVRSGKSAHIYLNGRPEISGEIAPTHANSTELFVGGRCDHFADFEGRIDEVAVWSRALSREEVAMQFASAGVKPSVLPPDPLPSSPADTIKQSHVREGFRIELAAAEPEVKDPVAIDWGADGKLWVAEMADYPSGIDGKGKPGGRIVYLLDQDGDRKYETRKVFMEGVSFPTGVMAWKDGVIVTASPEVFYAEDTDGDGIADKKEVWFSGFMEGNQQLRINGLRWGLDNWIYCANGGHHAGFGTKTVITAHKTGEKIPLGSRDFRFREDGSFEPVSGPSQFGRVRDDFGNWFGVQNSMPLWHYVIDDRYLARNPHVPAPDPKKLLLPKMPPLYPAKTAQKRFHGFDHVGHYTSACGISMYRDEVLFPYRGVDEQMAFTCAPFHNLVQRHVLTANGTSFKSTRGDDGEIDFFASRDRWCRPVMTRTGPDGALWIVDFHRYMIEHPQWLPPNGKEELKPHYRSGDDRGRIYRIVPEDSRVRGVPDVLASLADAMASPNGIVRDLAHREIVAGSRDVAEELVKIAVDAEKRKNLPAGALRKITIQALSALDGLGKLDDKVLLRLHSEAASLTEPDPRLLAFVIKLSEGRTKLLPILAAWSRGANEDPVIQLQLALTLGQFSEAEAGEALARLATVESKDAYIQAAIASSALPHSKALIARANHNSALAGSLIRMSSSVAGLRESLIDMLQPTSGKELDSSQLELLRLWQQVAAGNKGALHEWPEFKDTFRSAEKLARTAEAGPRKIEAIKVLGHLDSMQKFFLSPSGAPALQDAAIAALGSRGDQASVDLLLDAWRSGSPEIRNRIVAAVMNHKAGIVSLLNRLESGKMTPLGLEAGARQRLVQHGDKSIRSRSEKIFSSTINKDRAKVVDTFQPSLKLTGNKVKGRELFSTRCAVCHKIDDLGKDIGPNLRAVTDRSGAAMLVSILDPNRSVEPRYLAYTVKMKSKETVFGMISAETGNSLILHLLDGSKRAVLRKNIESIESSQLSLMPGGLDAEMTQQQMADLLEFLK